MVYIFYSAAGEIFPLNAFEEIYLNKLWKLQNLAENNLQIQFLQFWLIQTTIKINNVNNK